MNCFQASIPIMKALCDETRLQILSMLSEREMNGCEIHRAFDCTQPTISYHMKALVDVGLVHARREGCATVYTINREIWPGVEALLHAICRAVKGEKAREGTNAAAATGKPVQGLWAGDDPASSESGY